MEFKKFLKQNVGKFFLPIFLLLIALFFFIKLLIAWSNGYSKREMDWNGDGKTTITEFYEAGNIGTRNIQIDSQPCKEFFALKDAYPLRTMCQVDKTFKATELAVRQREIGNLICKETFSVKNKQTIEINCHPDVVKKK